MAKQRGSRLLYADRLRVAASLAVVAVHICGAWIDQAPVGSAAWNTLNVYDSLVHWCVPVFVMLSGMFLLDPERKVTGRDLLRHGLRIAVALAAWSAIYALAGVLLDGKPLGAWWGEMRNVVWGKLPYHPWFLPMLLGPYLLTPVLRAFVRGAAQGEMRWFFLLVFGAAMVLPTLLAIRPSKTVSTWMNQLDLRMVLGYGSYYILGYCLKTCRLSRRKEGLIYLLGLAGAVWTAAGTAWLSAEMGPRFTFYGYFSPNVACMASAVFLLFRRLPEGANAGRWTGPLAGITFGIYLCHDLFLMLLRHWGVSTLSFAPVLSVPVLTLGVFGCAALTAWLLSRLPVLGRYLT